MVETADLRYGDHFSQLRRLYLPRLRRVFVQRQVRARLVIIRKISGKHSSQTGLMENDQPSRPGDVHPEALTDPDVNLSIHPARATY